MVAITNRDIKSIKNQLLILIIIVQTNLVLAQNVMSIAGEWQIKLDPYNQGIENHWFSKPSFSNTVKLPGCLQEQGYGEIPGPNTVWWDNTTMDSWFKVRPWLSKYNTTDNFKTQAFLLPERYYIGAAWYSKEIEVPKSWDNQNIILFLERCHWETQLWVDGKFVGSQRSLATPHEYNLLDIKSGKHKIVLRVDNSRLVDLGPRAHATSDQTAGTWNGIIGKLELRKQAAVRIKKVRAFPNISKKQLRIEIEIENLVELRKGEWKIEAIAKGYKKNLHNPEPVSFSGKYEGNTLLLTYPLGKDMKVWDEFDPNLYELKLHLTLNQKNEKYEDNFSLIFGMKEFKAEGTQFTMNGMKTFLRGNADCAVMPKTGYTPTDVESWKKVWQAYKDFGLNMARFHSWCPPEAAFVAADEMGVYLAPEVGEWTQVDKASQLEFFLEESRKILDAYGNHASFIQMGLGNERGGNTEIFKELLESWRTWDNRHLYTIKANANYANKGFANVGADYEVLRKTGKEPSIPARYQAGWPPKPENSKFISDAPQTTIDWREAVQVEKKPIIQHETAQICAYPNITDELIKYTGYLKPTYLEIAKEQLQERGMLDQLSEFVEASGKWQVELTREEFEAGLRTPGLAGFHWLGLSDFTGQDVAPVGFTDAFYDKKSYVNPELVRRWNASTVLLARMPKRVLTSKDIFYASVEVSHYGKEKLIINDGIATLKATDGTVFKTWDLPKQTFNQGGAQQIHNISFKLSSFTKPQKIVFALESPSNNLINEWDIWIFPKVKNLAFPDGIEVVYEWNKDVLEKLEDGRKVLMLPKMDNIKGDLPVCFTNHYWTSFGENGGQSSASGVLINPEHPFLKDFPTDNHVSWQWWDILTQCRPMILDSYKTKYPWPKDFVPLLQPIDSWNLNRKLALVVEAKIGKGKLLICSIDIENDLVSRPAAKQFRTGLINYMNSSEFNPKNSIEFEMIQELFKLSNNK